jgi:lipoic acid synthetase
MKIVRKAKPPWLRRRLPTGPEYERMRSLLRKDGLITVCQEAQCPNQFECFSKGTATFMILGERCSRNCRFCAVGHGPFGPPSADEPERVAVAVASLRLRYAVITSVTRDDLPDGGADHFAATIAAVKAKSPETLIEVLIPDFQGDHSALAHVVAASPNVLNHNMETIARLYPTVRPQAQYRRSLDLLGRVKEMDPAMVTKSGLMLGLGETTDELREVWRDLRENGCDILTMGQYLQPSDGHLPVAQFRSPEEFEELAAAAATLGFAGIASGPFVRSSYRAEQLYNQAVSVRI